MPWHQPLFINSELMFLLFNLHHGAGFHTGFLVGGGGGGGGGEGGNFSPP